MAGWSKPIERLADDELASDESHAALYDLLADAQAATTASDLTNRDEEQEAA